MCYGHGEASWWGVLAPMDSCGRGEGVPSSRRGFGFPVAGRGSSGHGDMVTTAMRKGDQGGSRGVVTAWSQGVRGCVCS